MHVLHAHTSCVVAKHASSPALVTYSSTYWFDKSFRLLRLSFPNEPGCALDNSLHAGTDTTRSVSFTFSSYFLGRLLYIPARSLLLILFHRRTVQIRYLDVTTSCTSLFLARHPRPCFCAGSTSNFQPATTLTVYGRTLRLWMCTTVGYART